MAEYKGNHEIVGTLLLHGARSQPIGQILGSPFLVALKRGKDELAISLLNARSCVELDPSGLALHKACELVSWQSLQPCKAILTFTRQEITSLY